LRLKKTDRNLTWSCDAAFGEVNSLEKRKKWHGGKGGLNDQVNRTWEMKRGKLGESYQVAVKKETWEGQGLWSCVS